MKIFRRQLKDGAAALTELDKVRVQGGSAKGSALVIYLWVVGRLAGQALLERREEEERSRKPKLDASGAEN